MACACRLSLLRLSSPLPPQRTYRSDLVLAPAPRRSLSLPPFPVKSSKSTYLTAQSFALAFPGSPEPSIPGGGNDDSGDGGFGGSDGFSGWWNRDDCGGGSPLGRLLVLFLCSRALTGRSSSVNKSALFIIVSIVSHFCAFRIPASALARAALEEEEGEEIGVVWEVQGGRWTKLVRDPRNEDAFVVASPGGFGFGDEKLFTPGAFPRLRLQCRELLMRLMLPEGFPDSVTSDYLDYSLWRGVQGIASQISGVLATQVGHTFP